MSEIVWERPLKSKKKLTPEERALRYQRLVELYKDLRSATSVYVEYNKKYGQEDFITYGTTARYVLQIKRRWQHERDTDILELRDAELEYALNARAYAREQFRTHPKHPVAYGRLEGEWTQRIANLMGLDAPKKIDTTTTDKDWRVMLKEYAEKEGITEEEAQKRLLNEVNEIANDRLADGEGTVLEGEVAGENPVEPVELETDSRQERDAFSAENGV